MNRTTMLSATALAVGLLAGLTATPAVALTTNGASGTWGTAPYDWTNWATLDNTAKVAKTNIRRTSGALFGINQVKVNARLFRSDNNALCTSTGYIANSTAVYSFTRQTNSSYCGYINHYSMGQTQAWNGSTYTTYATYIAGPLLF